MKETTSEATKTRTIGKENWRVPTLFSFDGISQITGPLRRNQSEKVYTKFSGGGKLRRVRLRQRGLPPSPATLAFHPMKRLLVCLSAFACSGALLYAASPPQSTVAPNLATSQEKHLRNVRQLSFGGQNAEAYFSADGKKLIFQSTRDNLQCDQEFTMNV